MNITLIGMAGVGKSTVGKGLAKRLKYAFIDVDELIEKHKGKKLQRIIDQLGEKKFLEIEEKAILELGEIDGAIISPGGSVVYSQNAMKFLRKISTVVFLNGSFESIEKVLKNTKTRGIIGLKEKKLRALFNERMALYKEYAEITIEMPDKFDLNRSVKDIMGKFEGIKGKTA